MTDSIRMHRGALDRFELPVVLFDTNGALKYANRAAKALLKNAPESEVSLATLFEDSQEFEAATQQLTLRMQGGASAYHAHFTQPVSKERIPISIYAFPEVDDQGTVLGSIAIVRDMREQVANLAMHEAIETLRDNQALLHAVSQHLARLVNFDVFRITAVSRDRKHLRRIFSSKPDEAGDPPFRWWAIPPFIQATLDDETPRIIDVDDMFSQQEYRDMAANDIATRHFLEAKVKRILSIPILYRDQIVAFIGLDSARADAFIQQDIETCARLPLGQATLMALHYEDEACLRTSLDLIRELNLHAENLCEVANILARRFVQYFGWDHVIVFQEDKSGGGFRVLTDKLADNAAPPSPAAFAARDSVVKRAFDTQEIINIENTAGLSGHGDEEHHAGTLSQLVVPVPGDIKRWVVRIDSRLANAFAEEEIDTVRRMVAEAGLILERAALLEMSDAILRSINDAVIETDEHGSIRKANPAAQTLLSSTENELIGNSLQRYIVDDALRSAIGSAEEVSPQETSVLWKAGSEVPVLLSGSRLPAELGGKVFVLSDLTYQKELQRIDLIKEVFRQAALESRVPLALAAAWLNQLAAADDATADAIDKVLKQLRKADLPLERLMRRASGRTDTDVRTAYTDLVGVVESILEQFPKTDRHSIRFQPTGAPITVPAPEESVRFCIESMLSFAIRTKPQNRMVSVDLTSGDTRTAVTVRGDWVPDFGTGTGSDIRDRWRRQAIADLALGQDILEREARIDGGCFTSKLHDGLVLQLDLPKMQPNGGEHGVGSRYS